MKRKFNWVIAIYGVVCYLLGALLGWALRGLTEFYG